MKKLCISLLVVLLFVFSGCSLMNVQDEVVVHETKNPDAKEILTLEPNADIFQYDDVIYITHIDWVDELEITKDEQVGEIKAKNETDTNFENDMANKLQVGTKIFSVKERNDILIVKYNEETLRYLALVEG